MTNPLALAANRKKARIKLSTGPVASELIETGADRLKDKQG